MCVHCLRLQARQEFESTREEIKNRNSEEYNVLKLQLEGTIDDLEQQFNDAHRAYKNSTEARTAAFRSLTESDKESAKTISQRMRKLNKLQQAIQHWRVKISSSSRAWEERNAAVRNERNVIARHYQELRSRMNRFRNGQAAKLKSLTLSSNSAINRLNEKLQTAEKVVKLGEVCRKLETEEERVRPFRPNPYPEDTSSLLEYLPEDQREDAKALLSQTERAPVVPKEQPAAGPCTWRSDEENNPIPAEQALLRFHNRHNKAALDLLSLRSERSRLEQENADLRALLKRYLDGVSVNEDVMADPNNPLLIDNFRFQATLPTQKKNASQKQPARQLQYHHAS